MQDLQIELDDAGHDIQVVIVNVTGGSSSVSGLISKCDFPVFQDIAEVDAWGQHSGGKDDIIIYNSDGTLSTFLDYGGGSNINLGTPGGYANVRTKILEAY